MAPVALPDSCLRDWLHAASVDGKVLDKTMIKLEEEDVFGYWTTPSFRRSDSRIEGPLPRHLPEVASRNPRQCSKGNGDSGRLVPRTRAGEQALQRDTPLNTESFARKGRSCSPSCSRTLPCACACARVRWIQAVAGMGEAWASVTYRQSRRECPHVLSGALGVASRDDIQWSESAVNVVFLPVNVV